MARRFPWGPLLFLLVLTPLVATIVALLQHDREKEAKRSAGGDTPLMGRLDATAGAGHRSPTDAMVDSGGSDLELPRRPRRSARRGRRKAKPCCTIHIISVPTGAVVRQGSVALGRTPFPLQLQPGERVEVILAREGWAEKSLIVVGRDNERVTVTLTRAH